MPEMVKVTCLRAVRVSDDGIRNRLIEPGPDLVDVPASAVAGLVAEGFILEPGAAVPPPAPPQTPDVPGDGDKKPPAAGLHLKHVGFGNWVVADAAGARLTEPVTKDEAATALAAMVAAA